MKTLILTAALVATATLGLAQNPAPAKSSANPDKSGIEVAVVQRSNDEVNLLMEKQAGELIKVKVYEGKKLLYSQRIKKQATANVTYDISAFPDGDYKIEVVKDKEVVYSVDINKGSGPVTTEESESLAGLK